MALGTSGPIDAAYECVRFGCIPIHVKETQSREPIITWDESFVKIWESAVKVWNDLPSSKIANAFVLAKNSTENRGNQRGDEFLEQV